MAIFLTGKPKSGKSTVLMKIIQLLKDKGLTVGGFITPEIRKAGKRIGFAVRDVLTDEEGLLASVDIKTKPRLGIYGIDVKGFERIALAALDAVNKCDVVAIDEIGTMELFSDSFRNKLLEILDTEKTIIAVLHRSYVDEYRRYGRIIEVTAENRDRLPEEVAEMI